MCAMVVHVLHSSFRLSIVFMIAISSAPLSMPPPMWKLLSGILRCEELFVSLISIGLSKKKKKGKVLSSRMVSRAGDGLGEEVQNVADTR